MQQKVIYRKTTKSDTLMNTIVTDFRVNKILYLMILPVIIYYIIFCYKPMYGAIIAFKDFSPAKGILGSQWVGFKHFVDFFNSYYFWRILKNTVVLSLGTLIFSFPAPIILALMINEIKNKQFAKVVQTISYLPHFISMVVICSLIRMFCDENGLVNYIAGFFGAEPVNLLSKPEYFVPVYIISDIWQTIGWGSIVYLAALTNLDPQLYEAAVIDGAGKWKQTINITIPGIMPTILIMLILRMGNMLNIGFEKIILLYNPLIYETADVISSFVYRKGLQEFSWSFSAAVGLFNSVINFMLLIASNKISQKINDVGLW